MAGILFVVHSNVFFISIDSTISDVVFYFGGILSIKRISLGRKII